MKLKPNSFETVFKLFRSSFILLRGQFLRLYRSVCVIILRLGCTVGTNCFFQTSVNYDHINTITGISFSFFICFIWIRHEVHRNKYKTQKKNRGRDIQRKTHTHLNDLTITFVEVDIKIRNRQLKLRMTVVQLGSPVSNKAEVRLLYLAKPKNRLTHCNMNKIYA